MKCSGIETLLATKFTQDAGQHRVPVAEEIKSNTIVHGAMDNLDQEENTLSGLVKAMILSCCAFKILMKKRTVRKINLAIFKCCQNQ